MNRALIAITMLFLLVGSAEEAMGYTLVGCGTRAMKWASNTYVASAAAAGFPLGPWRTALTSVATKWANNPSNLDFSITYNDTSVGQGNLQNEIWWSSNFDHPAVTYWRFDMANCRFLEADIVFDTTVAYTYDVNKANLWPYGGSYRPFQTTAMHEFGHAAGLRHTANTYNLMGYDYTHMQTNGSIAQAYIGEDASAGVVRLYGLWLNGPEDVSVVHWIWSGGSVAGYSTHCRSRILNSAGATLPLVSGLACDRSGRTGAEPTYRVTKGQTVKLELSYESLGKSTQQVAVGYYLSTDSAVTTADRFLGASSFSFSRNKVFTATKSLLIPTNLTSGRNYYLGAVVDYTHALTELREKNNGTYVRVRVQ